MCPQVRPSQRRPIRPVKAPFSQLLPASRVGSVACLGFASAWPLLAVKFTSADLSVAFCIRTSLDGLHEFVTLHRLVGIHRVQAGRVKASQPHVAHDHDLEGVFGVLEAVRQLAALQRPRLQEAEVARPVEDDVVEQVDADDGSSGLELCGDVDVVGRWI